MTPRGWLDIHGHFYPPSTPTESKERGELFRSVDFMVPGSVSWNPEETLRYNDLATVDMQMLSYIPQDHEKLRQANDYGREIVHKYPHRFGLLAALPTDDPDACLRETERTTTTTEEYEIKADGFAVSTVYKGVGLGDERLEPVWEELDRRRAVVHIHPDAYANSNLGRPVPLIEVAFDTCRTVVDMLYKGIFSRYSKIGFVLGHCGGALPALSGRLSLLGTEEWVPNPNNITREEMEEQLSKLFVDTAATAKTGLAPALQMVGKLNCIYGADCGVPCSSEKTMEENRQDMIRLEKELDIPPGQIATNGWALFPDACVRAGKFGEAKKNTML